MFKVLYDFGDILIWAWGFKIQVTQYTKSNNPCHSCYYDSADCYKDISRNYSYSDANPNICYYKRIIN